MLPGLHHFLVISGEFVKFGKDQEIKDGGCRFREKHDVIFMICDFDNCCCKLNRKHFWTHFLPSKFNYHSFHGLRNIHGRRRNSTPIEFLVAARDSCLDRVQCGLLLMISSATHLCCIIASNKNSQPCHTLWKMKSSFNFVFTQITAIKKSS